jgi:hypothetical protein
LTAGSCRRRTRSAAIPNLLTQPGARDLSAPARREGEAGTELREAQKVYTDEVDKVKTLQKQIADLRTRPIPRLLARSSRSCSGASGR